MLRALLTASDAVFVSLTTSMMVCSWLSSATLGIMSCVGRILWAWDSSHGLADSALFSATSRAVFRCCQRRTSGTSLVADSGSFSCDSERDDKRFGIESSPYS
jgi:hypothetical protein